MNKNYLYIYNNLINYTRNKDLYKSLKREDNFSDRLTLFLLHFSFFLKNYKNEENKLILQEIYDYNFRQLELSIREIGYGDQSINKKMKDYINLFYSILEKIEKSDLNNNENLLILLKKYINSEKNMVFYVDYFNKYRLFLTKNTLNNFTKDIINLNF